MLDRVRIQPYDAVGVQTYFFIRQSLEILFGPYKSPRILKPLDVYSAIMANSRVRAPTYLQSTLASVFLITLSTLFIPATLSLTLTAYLWTAFSGTALNSPKPIKVMRKTVLVTGARANKHISLNPSSLSLYVYMIPL